MNTTDTFAFTFTVGIALGAVLVVLGIGAYVLSEFASITALIPAIFGILIVLLGTLGRQQPDRAHIAAYGIGGLAGLGVLGSLRGLPDVVTLMTGGSVDSSTAAISQGVMILVCLALLAVVTKDVLDAR